jgi:Ni,Fe-hydrogenase III component G
MMEMVEARTSAALALAKEITSSWFWPLETAEPEPGRLDVNLRSSEDLVPLVTALRVKRLGYLAAITGLDLGAEAAELEVLYHFCAGAAVITLRLRLPLDAPVVPTLSSIIPIAEIFERELSEMLGITVSGLATPHRLYLPDEWPDAVYPLRKEFDVQSLAELAI